MQKYIAPAIMRRDKMYTYEYIRIEYNLYYNCYAPKAIMGCWNPGAPKIRIDSVVKQGRARCVRWTCLTHMIARPKVEMKPHVEIHGSLRDCNQVLRKLLTGRSQLLNTLGRQYATASR
jgi:hypothetical protein